MPTTDEEKKVTNEQQPIEPTPTAPEPTPEPVQGPESGVPGPSIGEQPVETATNQLEKSVPNAQPTPESSNNLNFSKEDFANYGLDDDEVEELLKYYAQDDNPEKIEEVVENNPEAAQNVLSDDKGNELNTEAEQIIDGNPHNVEVKDEAVEDFIEDERKEPGSSFFSDKKGLLEDDIDVDSYINDLQEKETPSAQSKFQEAIDKQGIKPEDANRVYNRAVGSFPKSLGGGADQLREYADYVERVADMDGTDPNKAAAVEQVWDYLQQSPVFDTFTNEDTFLKASERFTDNLDALAKWLRWKADWTKNTPVGADDASDLQKFYEQGIITDDDIFNAVEKASRDLGLLKEEVPPELAEDLDIEEEWLTNKIITENVKGSIDWDTVKAYKPGEDPIDAKDEDYDPRIEANNEYEYGNEPGVEGNRPDLHSDLFDVTEESEHDYIGGGYDKPAEAYEYGLPAVQGEKGVVPYEEPLQGDSTHIEWEDISWEDISDEVAEDESIPPEEKEEAKKRRWRLVKLFRRSSLTFDPHINIPEGSSVDDIKLGHTAGGSSARIPGRNMFGNVGSSIHSGSFSNPYNRPVVKGEYEIADPLRMSGSIDYSRNAPNEIATGKSLPGAAGKSMFGDIGLMSQGTKLEYNNKRGGDIAVGKSGIDANFTGFTGGNAAPTNVSAQLGVASQGQAPDDRRILIDIPTIKKHIKQIWPNGHSEPGLTITIEGDEIKINGTPVEEIDEDTMKRVQELFWK